jgi:hypothetical protein
MEKYKYIFDDDDIADRRVNEDRRLNVLITTFPIFTKSGTWIRKECRNTPERRIKNINVAETQMKDEEFNELFKEFS